jgi:hypothetical protein
MKALGVLGLGLFVAGFWTIAALACVRREKPEHPMPEVPKERPKTDVFMEFTFPQAEPAVSPARDPMTVEPGVPKEPGEPVGQGTEVSHSSAVIPPSMSSLEEEAEKLGRDDGGRMTEERAQRYIKNLEAKYLREGLISRSLDDWERAWAVREVRDGWGDYSYSKKPGWRGNRTEGWEALLTAWGILVQPE